MTNTAIRPATRDDAMAVHDLERSVFGADAWTLSMVTEEITHPRRIARVAVRDHRVVGYAVLAIGDESADLHRIAVAEPHRRTGIASALLAETLRAASTRTLLEVAAGNASALAFYACHGFVEIARRTGYYRGGSDAVVMERQP